MDQTNIVALASRLAAVMSQDVDEGVSERDVLDWLAATGLTLRPDEGGDAGVAYWMSIQP